MPVMRHLNVGGTTYDTVGEASVTQVLNSGTKIATVSIDGTSTDLYAPAGGSSVDPATATPSMDGTAAVGSSAKYAREDHVHPHDTSRVPVSVGASDGTVTSEIANSGPAATLSVEGGNIQNLVSVKKNEVRLYASDSGDSMIRLVSDGSIIFSSDSVNFSLVDDVTAPTPAAGNNSTKVATTAFVATAVSGKQATLVSGTNIKTINNESLLGSGNITTPTYTLPTASTSTLGGVKVDGSTITISDGVISSAGGGGFSKLTLYTDSNMTNLWVDSARTETLLEHYGYDLYAARDDFLSSDIIVVIYAGRMFSVLGWEIDTADEDFYVKVFDGTVSGKLVNNGTTITFAKAKVISVS